MDNKLTHLTEDHKITNELSELTSLIIGLNLSNCKFEDTFYLNDM